MGAFINLSQARIEGIITLRPKDSAKAQVLQDLQRAIQSASMTSGEASKTRGRSGWIASQSYGRIGRLGVQQLKAIQYEPGASGPLNPDHIFHLAFHHELISRVGPRSVEIDAEAQSLHIAYTDAEYTIGNEPQLGGIFFDGHGGKPGASQQRFPSRRWSSGYHASSRYSLQSSTRCQC